MLWKLLEDLDRKLNFIIRHRALPLRFTPSRRPASGAGKNAACAGIFSSYVHFTSLCVSHNIAKTDNLVPRINILSLNSWQKLSPCSNLSSNRNFVWPSLRYLSFWQPITLVTLKMLWLTWKYTDCNRSMVLASHGYWEIHGLVPQVILVVPAEDLTSP